MKIVFMGTPQFAVPSLEALDRENYSIELVITQEDRPRDRGKKIQFTPVKERAIELGLDVFQPQSINSKEAIERIKNIKPDFIIVVAYGQILKKEILSIPKYGTYNVHASLLPKYRGAAPINWAIIDGEEETGVTIMEIEEGLDTGDMILSKAIPIASSDDAVSLYKDLSTIGGDLMVEALELIRDNKEYRREQNHDLSSYASMLSRDMGEINWNDCGVRIINLIRGLKPWPSAFTHYKDETVKLHQARFIKELEPGQAGQIIKADDEGLYVSCQDGLIVIEELQFPGKRKMKVNEYLRGNSIEIGIILK